MRKRGGGAIVRKGKKTKLGKDQVTIPTNLQKKLARGREKFDGYTKAGREKRAREREREGENERGKRGSREGERAKGE